MDTEEFLEELFSIEALKFGSFTLASGKSSDFYLDLRYIPAYPKLFNQTIDLIVKDILSKLEYDIIIGIPLAGVPYSTGIGMKANIPIQLLRKEKKEHGLKRMIEGPDISGNRVILIDDLISSGYSKEFAITEIRKAGGLVSDLIVIVDRRGDNSQEWELNWKIQVHSLFKITSDDISAFKTTKSS